ncbi:MAG: threonine ammonia-lyase [Candidatus Lokiarchaeota archaeon]|nr:threonine ammonia-lyase [Candidatus Lokiarchaeota archaeon]
MVDYLNSIKDTYKRIKEYVKNTPLIKSTTFSEMSGNEVYLKLENFQKTGSFKIRGAVNKIFQLDHKDAENGLITASAGNHGQAVAYAASLKGFNSYIVVPEGTPINKISAIESYGAEIIRYGNTYDDAYEKARKLKEERDLTFIHAYNDLDIINGQGTIGLEIMNGLPEADIIVVPIGGGGLISGISSYCKNFKPEIQMTGIQTRIYNSMYSSFKSDELKIKQPKGLTIADGIAVKKPGDITFPIINQYVDEILCCNDDQIANAILLLMERAKIVVEGAGAISLAAILNLDYFNRFKDKKIVAVISGGNIDVNLVNRIIIRGLKESGRLLKFSTKVPDIPGALLQVLKILNTKKANIVSINHNRSKSNIPFKEAEVEIEVETRNQQHIEKILNALADYEIKILD